VDDWNATTNKDAEVKKKSIELKKIIGSQNEIGL